MLKVIIVRHGRTLWNSTGRFQGQSDIELSEEGLSQAQKLADNFPVNHIDAVYSSNLKRAFITGKMIADKFQVPITPVEGLREISFGLWEGLTYEQIHNKWPQEIETMFSRPDTIGMPEGESFMQVQERGVAALDAIIAQNFIEGKDKTVVLTAHGGIIRTLLAHVLHMPLRYIWTLRQDNTAVNIITYYQKDKEKCNIELINGTAHLSITQPPKLGRFS